MTEATEIQLATKSFRDQVAEWNEKKLRTEGEKLGIPGAETLDRATLREAIVQAWRDARREEDRVAPKVAPSRDSDR